MSKKIYIVSQLGVSNAGGVEKVSYYLNELLKDKYDVQIIKRGKLSFGKLNNLLQPFLISLRLAFLRNKFVIGNSWHCFLYPADISIHHGTSAGIMKYTGEGGFALKLTAWMEKISARRAKNVLAVSENCKKELVELYKIPEEKITVINNFVQDEVFTPSNKESKSNNQINVCFSGALCYKKGMDKLLEFSDYIENEVVPENQPAIKLNIATNYEKNAGPFLGRKNTSVQTGLTASQMPDFYRQNDIMFFPTRYEGFSMAALEALSSGLCLAGSDFAVSPELQTFDFCKLLALDTPPSQVAESVRELYGKFTSQTARQKMHDTVKEQFGTEQYRKKILAYVDEILSHNVL
ncbi:MAG: glycosyltransferase family 4 protein [Treponema sp.]|nr:glycosyltransferase family 4 protein [Treponema sp.]